MEEMNLIRNEEGLIKVYPLGNKAYQMFPERDDIEPAWVTDEELAKLINGEYIIDHEKKKAVIDIDNLREKREKECFSVINRGKLWYDNLTQEQLEELNKWYNDWLNVTETLVEPVKPEWIK